MAGKSKDNRPARKKSKVMLAIKATRKLRKHSEAHPKDKLAQVLAFEPKTEVTRQRHPGQLKKGHHCSCIRCAHWCRVMHERKCLAHNACPKHCNACFKPRPKP